MGAHKAQMLATGGGDFLKPHIFITSSTDSVCGIHVMLGDNP